MRFKEFLESISIKSITPAKMTDAEMIEWIKHNAIGHADLRTPIYRGVYTEKGAAGLYNTAELNRKAANTANYYNLWIDNHGSWSKYPKRSKSFICSSGKHKAGEYGNIYVVVPMDSAMVGICPRDDMWDSFKDLRHVLPFGNDMDTFMRMTHSLLRIAGVKPEQAEHDWDVFAAGLNKIDAEVIETAKPQVIEHYKEAFERLESYMEKNNLETMYEVYERLLDPNRNGFKAERANEVAEEEGHEMWVSGGLLLVEEHRWPQIFRGLNL